MVNEAQPLETRRECARWRGWYWIPVAAYAGLIFYLSSQVHPEDYVPLLLTDLGDKVLHGLEYGVLGVLCYRAFYHAAGAWGARYALLLAVLASAGYAVTDEVHQAFVPLREADELDVVADTIGAFIASFGWRRLIEP